MTARWAPRGTEDLEDARGEVGGSDPGGVDGDVMATSAGLPSSLPLPNTRPCFLVEHLGEEGLEVDGAGVMNAPWY